jgi:hypothetical protein
VVWHFFGAVSRCFGCVRGGGFGAERGGKCIL